METWQLTAIVWAVILATSFPLILLYERYTSWRERRLPKEKTALSRVFKAGALSCLLLFVSAFFFEDLRESSWPIVAFAGAGGLWLMSEDIPARARKESMERERLHAIPVGAEGRGSFLGRVVLPFCLQYWAIIVAAATQSWLFPQAVFPLKLSVILWVLIAAYWKRLKLQRWAFRKLWGGGYVTYLELGVLRFLMIMLLAAAVVLFDVVFSYGAPADARGWALAEAWMWFGTMILFVLLFLLPGRAVG